MKSDNEKQKKIYQFYINDNKRNDLEYHFKTNTIDTTKYNCLTFLPKALLFQFMRLANIYFLITAIIQCIPAISPLGAETALIPIIFVLSVSLIREAIEDLERRKLDKLQNSEPSEVYDSGVWKSTMSGQLKIGQLVQVEKDNTFPADLILIDSSLPEGICYIETGTLDGEKTLKLKSSPAETRDKFKIDKNKISNFSFTGHMICDSPNPALYQFSGKANASFSSDNKSENKDKDNEINDIKSNNSDNTNNNKLEFFPNEHQLLLKGAKLRNTDWIIGIVVYVGHHNKIMMNSKSPRIKYSSVENLMNRLLVAILILQCILCIFCACLRGPFYTKYIEDIPDFENLYNFGYTVESIISYFTHMLLLNTMIPISLIITLEITKLIQ